MSVFHLLSHNGLKALIDKITAYFYTKAEIDDMLSAGMKYEVVEELPATGVEGTIYLVPSSTSPSGDIYDEYIYADGDYEKIGTTKADLTNYYTKTETNTLLDGKQASVTITTNANTPTDNDTVIMQDSGNTGTTSFLRRKLSTLWNYFRTKKFPEVNIELGTSDVIRDVSALDFVSNYIQRGNALPSSAIVYERSTDGGTTWVDDSSHVGFVNQADRLRITIIGRESDGSMNVIYCQVAKHFINMRAGTCHYALFGINKEDEVYQITSGRVSGNPHPNSIYAKNTMLGYYKTQYQADAYIKHRFEFWQEEGDDTYTGAKYPLYVGLTPKVIWGGNNTLKFGVPYVITTDNTTYKENVKFPQNVEATKFVKTGGTNSQVLLANGDVMSLPVPINKGGTGATTAIGAEYNILNQVADISTTLSDTRKIALCNQTKSASNGVFRWIALSNVWAWIKTHFDSSPTSGSGNGITSGGVYSALEEKVNLQPDFTVSQIDYSAGNVGKWQKVLRFPEGADLVINMKKTAMGSDATSTLWFSSSSMGDSYTSLFGNHSVRFVHDGGYVFLVLTCRKSTNEPIESYTFQIAHSSVPMSDIVAVTDASPITATPKEPNIVYRAPMTTGAVSFNVNSSGAGSVAMANHNDFLGNMTSEATNGVVVTMSGATEGQIYRFVFTRNITGGVTFKQSNVAYCTISGDVNAGDTITLTAVSNTADGWLYEQESAGIKSTDGSVNVEYDGGVADLSINIPPDVVRNSAYTDADGHDKMAIGRSAQASGLSATAVGRDTQANGYQSAAYGCFAQANGYISAAFGPSAKANAVNAVALGVGATAGGQGATAVGMSATANGISSLSLGNRTETNYDNSIAVGTNAVVCKREVDANDNVKYRRFREMILQSFTVDGEKRKFYKPETAGDVTITFSGQTATVNVTNGTLFVVNDSYAPDITAIFNGMMIDGKYYDTMDGAVSLSTFTVTPISGLNAWAIDIKMPLAYIDTSEVNVAQLLTEILSAYSAEGCAIGSYAKSYGGYALGRGSVTTFPRQTVVGQYNVPNDSDYFQVGDGNGELQRRNILTIDSNERLNASAYVGGTQTIEMSQQTGSLSNITKAVYRIRWNDTGTVNLTLDTGGCVEGQRVTIFAETNDVSVSGKIIVTGRYMDFVFIAGDWRAPQDPWQ